MSSVTFLFIFVTILTIVFLLLNFILAPHNPKIWIGKSINRDKLPNSGELLKLKVPSCSWKTISGWNNYSVGVISNSINENLIGNRRSKSRLEYNIVKEERVDGNWYFIKKIIWNI